MRICVKQRQFCILKFFTYFTLFKALRWMGRLVQHCTYSPIVSIVHD